MLLTSSEAAKLLKKLNEECMNLKIIENERKEFIVAISEDIESVRPDYSYKDTKKLIDELEEKIRKVKYSINLFNINTQVPNFNMTVDMLLVYLPQLTDKKNKLDSMRKKMKKQRQYNFRGSNIIEYSYINYDLDVIEKDYKEISEKLSKAQNELDIVNTTLKIEINL